MDESVSLIQKRIYDEAQCLKVAGFPERPLPVAIPRRILPLLLVDRLLVTQVEKDLIRTPRVML